MHFQVVVLDFSDFATEACCDFVMVYDGGDTKSRLIVYLSDTPATPPTGLTTTQQYMFIRFTSDDSINDRGFRATFRSVSSGTMHHGSHFMNVLDLCSWL